MIDIILFYGTEIVLVRIQGSNINFSTSSSQGKYSDISGLRIDKRAAIKKWPDLEDKEDWKDEAVKRFKEHIKSMPNEEEIYSYVINELRSVGYIPKYRLKQGFRRETIR